MLTTGQVVNNRYRITRQLGQGGFGAVYRAWDMTLERPCAIKENLAGGPDEQRQFLREAKLLANLTHPGLPRVTDYFTDPNGRQYLVMDFIEGESLDEMLIRTGGPLSEAQVLHWFGQVCDALNYLHNQSPPVIHRDIKPANIRITPAGQAMLVDFGIAKQLRSGEATTEGARAVTPGYSPVEQYGSGFTNARSDIYALGATLYKLLSGLEPPESVQRMTGKAYFEPGNPGVSDATWNVVLRATQLGADQRFQSIAEMRAALAGTSPAPATVAVSPAALPRAAAQHPRVSRQLVAFLLLVGSLAAVVVIALGIWGVRAMTNADETAAVESGSGVETSAPTQAAATPLQQTEAVPLVAGATRQSALDGGTQVYIPAGESWMGSTDIEAGLHSEETPRHEVYLDAYWIDQTEVSNGQYQRCVQSGSCQPPLQTGSTTRKLYYGNVDYAGYPVVWVTWDDARRYCAWAGKKLPTEAQWERAARGEAGESLFPWGSGVPNGERANFCDLNCEQAWKDGDIDDGYADTSPVGFFERGASPYGVLDMAGNVWEWVRDFFDALFYRSSPFENPSGPQSGAERVLRGGSFENSALDIRSANRFHFDPSAGTSSFGFRCVEDAP